MIISDWVECDRLVTKQYTLLNLFISIKGLDSPNFSLINTFHFNYCILIDTAT